MSSAAEYIPFIGLFLSVATSIVMVTAWITGRFAKRDITSAEMEQRLRNLEKHIAELEKLATRVSETCKELNEQTIKMKIIWKYVEDNVARLFLPRKENDNGE